MRCSQIHTRSLHWASYCYEGSQPHPPNKMKESSSNASKGFSEISIHQGSYPWRPPATQYKLPTVWYVGHLVG
jgi:hypothetical protein